MDSEVRLPYLKKWALNGTGILSQSFKLQGGEKLTAPTEIFWKVADLADNSLLLWRPKI